MTPDLPVRARMGADLRLVEADPAIEALQLAAGAAIDGIIAPPQLAALVRLARKTGEETARLVHVATPGGDAELWVRVTPSDGGFALEVEQWRALDVGEPRLDGLAVSPASAALERVDGLQLDAGMRITGLEGACEQWFDRRHVGEPLTRLMRFEDEDGTFPLLDALGARAPFVGQHATHRDTQQRFVLSGTPEQDEAGQFKGYRVAVASEQAEGASPAQAQDAGSLDATLRSPLDRIIRAADQIVDRSDGPIRSDYADYAGDIATAGRHLLSVIRSMSEQVVSEREQVKLSVVAREAAGLVAAKAADKKIDIEIDDDLSVMAVGERRAVLQILVNILGNAIRHSPDEGTVAIVFHVDGDRASVTVADQGPGIARADQKKIFEKFERLDAEAGTGTGLGLAISRRLARSMDGEIELDSAAGEGARFTLTLPAA